MTFIVSNPDGTSAETDNIADAMKAGGMNPHQMRQLMANLCNHDFVPFQRGEQVIYACQHCRAIRKRT